MIVSRPGGGGPRRMSVRVSNADGALLVIALLVWTVIMLLWLAPTQ